MLAISKKAIAFFLCLVVILTSLITYFAIKNANSVRIVPVIVIDAGHGGIDGGSVGFNGTIERDINLEYAKTLQNYCTKYGMNVIMTRSNEKGLYSIFASNKKRDDMQVRKSIIIKAKPNFVVSIHMNSYKTKSTRGAQVFYEKTSESSKLLAQSIQNQFVKMLEKPRQSIKDGDYYILNCTSYPSVIVECGFISNQEEETLLLTNDYKSRVCYAILCGIVNYTMQ